MSDPEGAALTWAASNAEIVALELAFGTAPKVIAVQLRTLPGHLIAQLRATGHGDLARAYAAELELIDNAAEAAARIARADLGIDGDEPNIVRGDG